MNHSRNQNPKISVIVPCYNVEKFLDRCVYSLTNQSFKDIEIILVDDGSPDKVPELCDNWAKLDNRIIVIHKKNGGLGFACNSGLEVASGEYITFCDSDDWVDPDYFKVMYDTVKKHDADTIFCNFKTVDERGQIKYPIINDAIKLYEDDKVRELQLNMISTKPKVWAERMRAMSAKVALYSSFIIHNYNIRFKSEREYISEDLIFNLDYLTYSKRVIELPYSFYNYYINNQSLTHTYRKDRFNKYKQLRLFLLKKFETDVRFSEYKERIDKMFIGYVRNTINKIVLSDDSIKSKYELISIISKDYVWQEIASEFPVKDLPASKRFIFQLLHYNSPSLLLILMSLINYKSILNK